MRWTLAAAVLAAVGVIGLAGGSQRATAQTANTPGGGGAAKHTFAIGENDFLLDGQRLQIRCGEIHAPRVPMEYWRHRLKMAKAMGLNAVCAYLFWNMHEPRPGEFNWSGQADAAAFCRIAQEEGLWVILRPGPYACAEWEMGGFPWWLLKDPDVKLRTQDPKYIEAATRYLKEVARVMGPLQVTRGGPILMVQVENEYGFYGKDAAYMGVLRKTFIDAGIDVPLFACNPVQHLKDGYRDDLFPVVNFGSNPAAGFRALRQVLPKGPLMCGEFYPGWFDTWGAPHHLGKSEQYLTDLGYMLDNNASFSIYMAHGGTTFGLWSGADRPFKPDTSSYDYDAPISEAGWVTPKFTQTRELMRKHLLPGETLPEPPAANPVIAFPAATAARSASVFANLPAAISDAKPRNVEQYDLGYGNIVYRTTLPAGAAGILDGGDVRDYGHVFLDGVKLGVMDRRSRNFKVPVPAREKPAQLDIFVETAGRVNFGQEVHDRKGINVPVKFTEGGKAAAELAGPWQVFPLPLDKGPNGGTAPTFATAAPAAGTPAYWEVTVNLATAGDTFIDMSGWGKGVAWVNGHCLGRFWAIRPTQTMYVPGPWLKAGANTFVILDTVGPAKPELAGLEKPVLDQLRPERDFSLAKRPVAKLQLEGVAPAMAGTFAAGTALQEVSLPAAVTGRFFCLEAVDAQDGKNFAAVAELDLLGKDGKPLSHEGWTVAYVDSEERAREDGTAENAIDGQTANYWHTEQGNGAPPYPHRLVLDLGQSQTISGFRYVPRQGNANATGRIKTYKVYVGDGLVQK
jgi:beta-galactosidase